MKPCFKSYALKYRFSKRFVRNVKQKYKYIYGIHYIAHRTSKTIIILTLSNRMVNSTNMKCGAVLLPIAISELFGTYGT